jgi:hypothetical protein
MHGFSRRMSGVAPPVPCLTRSLSSRAMRTGRLASIALGLTCLALGPALAGCGGDDGDDPVAEDNQDLFTSDGFESALDAVAEEAGDAADLQQIQVTQAGADFKLREAEGVRGLIYTGGELRGVEVEVVGEFAGESFPLSEVDPEALTRIIAGVQAQTGNQGTAVTALTLDRGGLDGELRWTVRTTTPGPDSSLNEVFFADAEGTVEPD